MLWIDFETRSRCDLRARGVYNYARDGSTDVLCMSWAFDDEDVQTWLPGTPFPERVREHKGLIAAHNAAFERLIFWYVLQINYDLEQFYCTATQARANCAPGSLEDAGRFAGASMRKDHRGGQLVRALCIPRPDGTFNDDPTLMAELVAYCEQDVRTMRAISQAMRPLSATELADYHVNERINDRGVLVDVPLAKAAIRYSAAETADLEKLVVEISEGAVTSIRSPRMRQWVWDRVGPQARGLMTVLKDGEHKRSIDKNVRASLLVLAEENPDEVPPVVADVIQCADDLWASSVAKFARMADLADDEDHRVRGAFVFAGGAATGRAASYGAQWHNFARKTAKDPEAVRLSMTRHHDIVPLHGKRTTDVLKGMLRPTIIPEPGSQLVIADWSAIEARVNPWLSNCPSGEAKLDLFRAGEDIYKVNASAAFNVPVADVDDTQRQVGKVMELAAAFGGSVGAFNAMGRIYGVVLPEAQSRRMVEAWRKANPWAQHQWSGLERAYYAAMRNKGCEITAGRITYLYDGRHLWYALPSGRVLCYPHARFEKDGITYAKAAWKPAQGAEEWPRARLWHGLACENCWTGDTLVRTLSGWRPIADILPTDLLWDGEAWVAHDGVVCNGEQEIVRWAGTRVTPNHRIHDGTRWRAVIDLDGPTTDGCLSLGRSSEPKRSSPNAASGASMFSVVADVFGRWRREACAVLSKRAGLALLPPRRQKSAQTSSLTIVSAPSGCTAEQARSPDAILPLTRLGLTTVGEVSPYTNLGGATPWRGWHMLSPSLDGMSSGSTSTASTTTETTPPAICGSYRGVPTPTTEAVLLTSRSAACGYPLPSSGGGTARTGEATTPSHTTSDAVALAMKSPRFTGERAAVYDIRNAGPRHRYMVLTPLGPVIAHNCTQAVANDLLRDALRRLDAAGQRVILHIHDEIVLEADDAEAAAAQLEAVMATPPAWAAGLPLAAEVKIRGRYGK